MDGYELRAPEPQNALDIFAGDLTSMLPLPECAGLAQAPIDHMLTSECTGR